MSTAQSSYSEGMPQVKVQCLDGARFGWVAATWDGRLISIHSYRSLVEANLESFQINLIDMPIGLPESGRRGCDGAARSLLIKRKSSIFTTPCRSAVSATSYQEACEINSKLQGIRLSKQSWNIVPKIREVDAVLQTTPTLVPLVKESHPELCFQLLNEGKPLNFNKTTHDGQQERVAILAKVLGYEALSPILEGILAPVKVDTIDALGLLANYLKKMGKLVMLGDGQVDRFGLSMAIWV